MKAVRTLGWTLVAVWYGNALYVSDPRGRRTLIAILVVMGGLAVVGEWAARHQGSALARILLTQVGPALAPGGGRGAQWRDARRFFAGAVLCGIVASAVLFMLTGALGPVAETIALWLFPFAIFGTALCFAASLLLVARGILKR